MRKRIIEALTYPRLALLDGMRSRDCPHDGLIDESDELCRQCGERIECRWLTELDAFHALSAQPMPALLGALEFAIGYVDGRGTRTGHSALSCMCPECSWLRRARRLLNEAQGMTVY